MSGTKESGGLRNRDLEVGKKLYKKNIYKQNNTRRLEREKKSLENVGDFIEKDQNPLHQLPPHKNQKTPLLQTPIFRIIPLKKKIQK